jgi:putative SOS response-associated peptidase YedK
MNAHLAALPGAGEKRRPEGRPRGVAFLTTTPNQLVATINHERMPVLLTREEEFEAWLNGAPHVAFALAHEYPPGQMRIVQEGFKKQDLLAAAA